MPVKAIISASWARYHDKSIGISLWFKLTDGFDIALSRTVLQMSHWSTSSCFIISDRWACQHDKSRGISFWFTKLSGKFWYGIFSDGITNEPYQSTSSSVYIITCGYECSATLPPHSLMSVYECRAVPNVNYMVKLKMRPSATLPPGLLCTPLSYSTCITTPPPPKKKKKQQCCIHQITGQQRCLPASDTHKKGLTPTHTKSNILILTPTMPCFNSWW